MKVLVLGDVHTVWDDLNVVIAKAFRRHPDISHMVQVGDFGYHWPGVNAFAISRGYYPMGRQDEFYDKATTVPFYWLDGNHEQHDKLDMEQGSFQPTMIYQPRGSIALLDDRRALFFGGASSIDRAHRTEYLTWFRQESITNGQLINALKQQGPVDIMFSHDYPSCVQYKHSYKDTFGHADREALEITRQHFRPRFSIFGHHHEYDCGEDGGTIWACAPIIESREYLIWDGEEIIHEC